MMYSLESGNIDLKKITNKIKCSKCDNILVLINDSVFLLRNPATIIDIPNDTLVSKCTKCKTFNTHQISTINKKSDKTLLNV